MLGLARNRSGTFNGAIVFADGRQTIDRPDFERIALRARAREAPFYILPIGGEVKAVDLSVASARAPQACSGQPRAFGRPAARSAHLGAASRSASRASSPAGSAWAASNESQKSSWERLSYTVDDYRPAGESELHLLLVERGVCLIDDVSVRRGAGANHIPDPGFETSAARWIIEGTHQDSRRVTYDAHSGSACLELNASGKGDTTVNRIEVETSPSGIPSNSRSRSASAWPAS